MTSRGGFGEAALRKMAEMGLTIAQAAEIAAAMAADAKPIDRTAAERQARCRARKKGDGMSRRDVTRDPPNDISNPPEVTPVEADASTAPRGRRDRGEKIPEDWSPPPVAELSAETRKLAHQWPASVYRAEAEAFVNYWLAETGKASRKASWNRAWANRIVAIHSRVMRSAKFAAPEPTGPSRDWSPDERAAYLAKLDRREATGPPGQSLGGAASRVLRSVGGSGGKTEEIEGRT